MTIFGKLIITIIDCIVKNAFFKNVLSTNTPFNSI